MTIGEIIRANLDGSPVQFIHETLLGASNVKGKKGEPPYTRITIATEQMNCNDAFYWTTNGDKRKPKYVGVVIWIPFEAYESAVKLDAVDPSVADPGKLTTRAVESSL